MIRNPEVNSLLSRHNNLTRSASAPEILSSPIREGSGNCCFGAIGTKQGSKLIGISTVLTLIMSLALCFVSWMVALYFIIYSLPSSVFFIKQALYDSATSRKNLYLCYLWSGLSATAYGTIALVVAPPMVTEWCLETKIDKSRLSFCYTKIFITLITLFTVMTLLLTQFLICLRRNWTNHLAVNQAASYPDIIVAYQNGSVAQEDASVDDTPILLDEDVAHLHPNFSL